MTKILGAAQANAGQMAAYLLSKNSSPKINMPVLDFCRLFLLVGAKEGVRGDGLFAQSCWETNYFRFTGTVTPDQNNYAGLGTVNANTKGAYFIDEATGILAQAQHARGYATTDGLLNVCVDPRYSLLVKYGKLGKAENWEDLGGTWAVPGYSTKLYTSLKEANEAKDSYGYKITGILNEILAMPKDSGVEKMSEIIIALSAGHGYYTSGKRCMKALDPLETREWFLNDRIVDKVEAALKSYDCKVLRLDDTTGNKDVPLSTRIATANNAGANIYISTHHNAGIKGRSGGGTIVFCYPSVANLEEAQKLYDMLIAETGLIGDRSTKVASGAHLAEIRKTKMPCYLIENGFMDSKTDVPIILSEEHAEKTAKAIVKYVVDRFNLEGTHVQEPANIYYPACAKKYTSIAAALSSVGVNGSYANRKKIAAANGIKGYAGLYAQNVEMLNLLKSGLLKKV